MRENVDPVERATCSHENIKMYLAQGIERVNVSTPELVDCALRLRERGALIALWLLSRSQYLEGLRPYVSAALDRDIEVLEELARIRGYPFEGMVEIVLTGIASMLPDNVPRHVIEELLALFGVSLQRDIS